MIETGDKVMVCLSGGKDSYALLDILLTLRERAPIDFEIVAVNLDQKQPGFPAHVLPDYLRRLGVPFHIENQDTYCIVKRVIPEGKTTLLAVLAPAPRHPLPRGRRTRRHQDRARPPPRRHPRDVLPESVLRRQAQGACRRSCVSDDGKHIVIRPLAYVKEADLERYARGASVPDHSLQPVRLAGKPASASRSRRLMREWEKKHPGRVENIFSALSTVVPSHLMDRQPVRLQASARHGRARPDGDIAFDEEPCAAPDIEASRAVQLVRFDED